MAIRHPSPAAKWLFIFPRLGITRQIITQVDSIKARADGGRGGSPFHDVVRPAAEEKRRREGGKEKEKNGIKSTQMRTQSSGVKKDTQAEAKVLEQCHTII